MATRKTTAKAAEDQPAKAEVAAEEATSFAAEVHQRGGWDVGYVGDRVDEADDESYTVTGVLKAAQSGGE